jgi:hypothetical protein
MSIFAYLTHFYQIEAAGKVVDWVAPCEAEKALPQL